MIERRVEGVAILTFGRADPVVEAFRNRNLPVFQIDADTAGGLFKTARIDYEHDIREAVQHLAALGHVDIAFVSGPLHVKTAALRQTAFQQCIKEIGLATAPELLVPRRPHDGGWHESHVCAGFHS
jgi:LacI family transcriptional regulator